mmetsp:Transcript_56101/g.169693  ORF Transcript_56101/g.169693 Transcript_56101/m.169693 type:complete len:246 (-) Transcript_56101:3-740(-)
MVQTMPAQDGRLSSRSTVARHCFSSRRLWKEPCLCRIFTTTSSPCVLASLGTACRSSMPRWTEGITSPPSWYRSAKRLHQRMLRWGSLSGLVSTVRGRSRWPEEPWWLRREKRLLWAAWRQGRGQRAAAAAQGSLSAGCAAGPCAPAAPPTASAALAEMGAGGLCTGVEGRDAIGGRGDCVKLPSRAAACRCPTSPKVGGKRQAAASSGMTRACELLLLSAGLAGSAAGASAWNGALLFCAPMAS